MDCAGGCGSLCFFLQERINVALRIRTVVFNRFMCYNLNCSFGRLPEMLNLIPNKKIGIVFWVNFI